MLIFGIPLLPIAIAGLGVTAYTVRKRQSTMHGEMSGERQVILDCALETCKDPDGLNMLAAAFQKEGLPAQADILRKRALLHSESHQQHSKRRTIFKQAMNSRDPATVRAVADAYRKQGATGAANNLERYAQGLQANLA